MESEVGINGRLSFSDALSDFLMAADDRFFLKRRAPRCGEISCFHLNRRTELQTFDNRGNPTSVYSARHRTNRSGWFHYKHAGSSARIDQPFLTQMGNSLADDSPAHTETLDQLGFTWQFLARRRIAAEYALSERVVDMTC